MRNLAALELCDSPQKLYDRARVQTARCPREELSALLDSRPAIQQSSECCRIQAGDEIRCQLPQLGALARSALDNLFDLQEVRHHVSRIRFVRGVSLDVVGQADRVGGIVGTDLFSGARRAGERQPDSSELTGGQAACSLRVEGELVVVNEGDSDMRPRSAGERRCPILERIKSQRAEQLVDLVGLNLSRYAKDGDGVSVKLIGQ